MREVLAKGLAKHIEDAVIKRWYFEEGDAVTKGDDLLELVAGDESVVIITVPATGILAEVFFDKGETVQRDESLCLIDDEETRLQEDDEDEGAEDGDSEPDLDESEDDF
jgi:pyruvate/2-oxoglutarate dehydrogenase complex dihydrolipoamide acyltransferase (E2) component